MEQNIGKIDRIIRLVFALVFVILGWKISAWLYIIAAFLLLNATTGYCGVYNLFKIRTNAKELEQEEIKRKQIIETMETKKVGGKK